MVGSDNKWLHRFALATALASFGLMGVGGLVTSHEAGMAVPDWPTSYGYNMFLFPISFWQGGIFYEHTHRLFASFVGLLTMILAVWIWRRENRSWIRWLGLAMLALVILQGVVGGLRVVLSKAQLGIIHGTLAQIFLVLASWIALGTGSSWKNFSTRGGTISGRLRGLTVLAVLLILGQLMLGATMRHQHAGLAVPDFPLAYGRLWPRTDAAFIERINQQRVDTLGYNPITAFQVQLHMAHRLGAICILGMVTAVVVVAWRQVGRGSWFAKAACGWLGLVVIQAVLGAATVWSNKAADVATLHVMMGAASLVYGACLALLGFRAAARGARVDFYQAPVAVGVGNSPMTARPSAIQ